MNPGESRAPCRPVEDLRSFLPRWRHRLRAPPRSNRIPPEDIGPGSPSRTLWRHPQDVWCAVSAFSSSRSSYGAPKRSSFDVSGKTTFLPRDGEKHRRPRALTDHSVQRQIAPPQPSTRHQMRGADPQNFIRGRPHSFLQSEIISRIVFKNAGKTVYAGIGAGPDIVLLKPPKIRPSESMNLAGPRLVKPSSVPANRPPPNSQKSSSGLPQYWPSRFQER